MRDIESIIKELRQPFPTVAVDWKVQTAKKDQTGALVVAYVDARDVSERLNKVCPDQWSTRFAAIEVNNKLEGVECQLTIRTDDVALTRADVGVGDYEDDRLGAGVKTLYSDALKRAGVHFGINSCAYELPTIWLNQDQLNIWNEKVRGINDKGKKDLKDRYETWVNHESIVKRFGPVFDG